MLSVLSRAFQSVVDRFPMPSVRIQRIIAFVVIVTQGGISVTGAVVRVTGSGLGCPTWPQCFPGSFTPVGVSEVPVLHQAVEFGNRMLTFLVVLTAAAIVIAVTRARRRREVKVYAWLMPAGTVLQAGVGGITVLTGLLWWTVAVHLLISMLMVWLATLMFHKIGEPDDAVAVTSVPAPLRWLTAVSAAALSGVLVAGTMLTGAGPHAGDADVARFEVEVVTLVHLHAEMLVGYLALLIGLTFGVYAVSRSGATVLKKRLHVLLALVLAQSTVGIVQYFTDVPATLVAIHVAGAAACTAATAAVWAAGRDRDAVPAGTEPASVTATAG